MSRIPGLFYSTDTTKQTLHRRIVPSAEQQVVQQGRWNDLRDFLVGNLAERSGYSIYTWLQGSYKFGTQVRPVGKGGEFDIDLGVYFEWPGASETPETPAVGLKNIVQQSMLEYRKEADEDDIEVLVPPKERCARMIFKGDFHIDVPVYHLDRDADLRELATEKNEWEKSDPKAFYKWFIEAFAEEDSDLIRRLIRYFKIWAALKMPAPPSSVLLTVLVAEAYQVSSNDELEGDDTALRHVAAYIADRLERDERVLNPVNSAENLNRLEASEAIVFIEKLRELVDCADRALAASNQLDSATIWTEMFGYFFAAPDVDEGNKSLVPVNFTPEVSVYAQGIKNERLQSSGRNSIGPILRGCSLKFSLLNANELPSGATVEWIARNEGEEAELVNDLGHHAGYGVEITDASAYHGTHYMDVVVRSSTGQVIGFRRIPVKIMDMKVPARNPAKPGYKRYPRRR